MKYLITHIQHIMTMLDRQFFPLLIFYVTSIMQPFRRYTFHDRTTLYNNKTITLYLNVNESSTSLLVCYIIASLLDDGRNFRPKHVVVNVLNK
jgi:hypothetical protein